MQLLQDRLSPILEQCHSAVLVFDDENLIHVQEVRRDDDVPERSYAASSSIANDMCFAEIDPESRCRIDTGVDTGNCEGPESKSASETWYNG